MARAALAARLRDPRPAGLKRSVCDIVRDGTRVAVDLNAIWAGVGDWPVPGDILIAFPFLVAEYHLASYRARRMGGRTMWDLEASRALLPGLSAELSALSEQRPNPACVALWPAGGRYVSSLSRPCVAAATESPRTAAGTSHSGGPPVRMEVSEFSVATNCELPIIRWGAVNHSLVSHGYGGVDSSSIAVEQGAGVNR